MGRILIVLGIILVIMGIIVHYADKIPFLGKLPGDITIKREGFELHVPLMTSLLISILLSLILYFYYRFRG